MSARKYLLELGFSGLEAEAYIYLLTLSSATGYGVAKGIGKPTANTYKALESLLSKGAIAAEAGKKRIYRALPPGEVFDSLENRFRDQRVRAQDALKDVGTLADDDRVYHLETPEQFFSRFRALLEECEEIALLDLFPGAYERIRMDLTTAARRGLQIAIKVYEPVKKTMVNITFVRESPAGTLQRWPGQWCNGVFDGRRHILGLLTEDLSGVHQALWSSSCYVSWVYHSALSSEILFSAMQGNLEQDKSTREIRQELERLKWIAGLNALGYRELNRRYRAD